MPLFLMLATDGLWNIVTSQEAADMIMGNEKNLVLLLTISRSENIHAVP